MICPMKLCITFDDGLKSQAEIAVPLLRKYGFKVAFNIPTGFMNPNGRNLTPGQIHDCRLEGNEDNLMDWEDVRRLLEAGHEVYPHTLDHADLLELERQEKFDELTRQVVESKKQYIEHCGGAPSFFCSPHNSSSPFIKKIVHENGMELVSCWRRNFPTHPSRDPPCLSITEHLRQEYYNGTSVLDVMIHGIDANRGGWEPFADSGAFEAFLQEIHRSVLSGMVNVVPYSRAHRSWSALSLPCNVFNKIRKRVRRILLNLM